MCIGYNFIHDLSGPNGAGKTTTMKMIIAEEHPTKGRIKIGPYEIESNDSKGFDYLGYCPQVHMYKNIGKVHTFWEGQKILRNLLLIFDCSAYSQNFVVFLEYMNFTKIKQIFKKETALSTY